MGHIAVADHKHVMLPWGMLVYVRPVFACESNVTGPGQRGWTVWVWGVWLWSAGHC